MKWSNGWYKCIRIMILYQDSLEQKDNIYLKEKTVETDLNE